MSPLAKVFVVVNLIFSVVFFGSSAALFVTRTNWRERAIQFQKEAKDELEKVKDLYAKQGERITKIDNERTQLTTNYNSVSTDKQKLETELLAVKTQLAEANHRIDNEVKEKTQLLDAKTTLEKKNADLLAQVDTKTKEADDAKNEKLKAINEMTRVRLDQDKTQELLNKSQIENKEIGEKLASLNLQIDAIRRNTNIDLTVLETPPPINAVIEAVRPTEKLVVLSVGKNQKVQEGFKFTVYRGGHFVGKVQVTKVYDDLAGAKVIFTQDNEQIQIGDKAATQI